MSNIEHADGNRCCRVHFLMGRTITFTHKGETRSGRIIDATYWDYIDSEQFEVSVDGPGGYFWVRAEDVLTGTEDVPPLRR